MKQLKLALVLAGLVGVACGQSKAAEPEAAARPVQKESAPPAAAIPAAAAEPMAATVPAAAATPPAEAALAPGAETTGSLAPASKTAAKVSPRLPSKKAASLGKKGAVSSF